MRLPGRLSSSGWIARTALNECTGLVVWGQTKRFNERTKDRPACPPAGAVMQQSMLRLNSFYSTGSLAR
jgi:hypothetical protein